MSELATPVSFPLPHRQSLPEWPDVATDVLVLGVYISKFIVVNSCINQMAFTNDEEKDSQYNYGKRKFGKHPLYKLTDEKSGTVYYLNNDGDYFIHMTKFSENQRRAIKGVIQSPNRTKVVLNITISMEDGSILEVGNYDPQIHRLNVYLENLKNYSLVVNLFKRENKEQAFVHSYDAKMVEENLRKALIPPPSSVLVIGREDYAGGDQLFPPASLRSRLADFVKRSPTVRLLGI